MVDTPVILDLYCGAGGCADGYVRAGFQVLGIDKVYQAHYPFDWERREVFDYLDTEDLSRFDAIHASPPCQAYSNLRFISQVRYSDNLARLRDVLIATGKPYIIENIPEAPLRKPVILCGTMFPPLRVIRHRAFESNVKLKAPWHKEEHPPVLTKNTNREMFGQLDEWKDFVSVTGGGNCKVAAARDAMGVDWYMTGYEIAQAIPPPYTEYLGKQLIQQLAG